MRIATTQHHFEILPSLDDAAVKLEKICQSACDQNVQLLLLPEYAGMEFVWPLGKTFKENVDMFQNEGLEFYQNTLKILAHKYQLILAAGSLPVLDGEFYNRCYVVTPKGDLFWQDKVHLTPLEKKLSWLKSGSTLKLFTANFGSFAICICYDSEFPELATQAAFNGADLLLIPSYTESHHGANRVQIAARCRAMENQCFTANATAFGKVLCDEFDETAVGQAGVYTPIDRKFPEDGILSLGKKSECQMLIADLDFKNQQTIRLLGQVRNFADRQQHLTVNVESVIL